MFKAQTLILGLLEDFNIDCMASNVSDFMIRIRGTWGAGAGSELVAGSRGAVVLLVAVDDDPD
jgi:hypothetical protein